MNTATNSKARLEGILDQVRVLKTKYDERAEVTGENFNFFSFLNMERDEVKHSAIIAELLNPYGSHSQGKLFLKLFLEQLESIIDVSNEHTFIVRKEVYIPKYVPKEQEEGSLDIVIESDDAYIVIENKIDTVDAEGQLEKYCKHIETIEKQKKVLLYLTPKGKKPNNFNVCGKGPIHQLNKFQFPLVRLSYKDFIVKWLGNCIEKVTHISRIEETLHQYRTTVRKLTGQFPPEIEGILSGLKEKDDILKALQYELQYDFWMELKKQLEEGKDPRFQLYGSKPKEDKTFHQDQQKEIKDILAKGDRETSFGLTFSIPNSFPADNGHEVAFRIQYESPQKGGEYSHFNYGFVLYEKGNTLQRAVINNEKHEKYLKRYEIQGWPKGKAGGYYGWLSWIFRQHKPRQFIIESKVSLIRRLISEINLLLLQYRSAQGVDD